MFSNRDLALLYLPLVLEQAMSYSVEMADSMMVSSLGEATVSGVSLMAFIMTLLISIFSALATGGAVISSQALGAGDQKRAVDAANQLVKVSCMIGFVIGVLVLWGRVFLLDTLYSKIADDVRSAALTYITVVDFSIPFLAIYNSLAALFRVMGDSKSPMWVMFSMNLLNVAGNALFVFGFHWGVFGVALPTVFSRIGAAGILFFKLCKRKGTIYLDHPFISLFDWGIIKKILGIGVPYALENGLFNIGKLLLTTLMATLGTASIAANSVGGNIVMFQILAGTAIGLGLTTVVSQCIGAKDIEQAKYYTKKTFIIIYVSHFACTVVIWLLMPILLRIYDLSAEAERLLLIYYWMHGIASFTIWPYANTMPIVFRVGGNSKFSMAVSTATMICCRIILAYVLVLHFQVGVVGIWTAMVCDWVIKGTIYLWYYHSRRWLKKSNLAAQP